MVVKFWNEVRELELENLKKSQENSLLNVDENKNVEKSKVKTQ